MEEKTKFQIEQEKKEKRAIEMENKILRIVYRRIYHWFIRIYLNSDI